MSEEIKPAEPNQPTEQKDITTVSKPKFGQSGCVLASKDADGYSTYVSILDAEVGSPSQYIQLIDVLYHAKKGDTVKIFEYSYGGFVESGLAIIQAIFNTQAHVITIGMSIVASIAAVIWLAGHERRMMPGSCLMIHMPSTSGEAGKTLDIAEDTTQLNQYFSNLLADLGKGIITEEELKRVVENREDTFITAEVVNSRLIALAEGGK